MLENDLLMKALPTKPIPIKNEYTRHYKYKFQFYIGKTYR